jgi:gluconolactonase
MLNKTCSTALMLLMLLPFTALAAELVAPGAEVKEVAGGLGFTEGPIADAAGSVYFTDIPNNRIYLWTVAGALQVFRENTNGANGLFFDGNWQLFGAEGGSGRISRMDADGNATTVIETFNGKRFNSPNDLWIDATGGIYFTDPSYGDRSNLPQSGEHVYYLPAGASEAQVIITDLIRPNGIIGTRDGTTLYVADHGGNQTFAYTITAPGELSNKRLFAAQGSDGMTLDEQGNLYLTGSSITVYSPTGALLDTIEVPLVPANLTFGGPNRDILYITARTTFFALQMAVKGMY